MAAPSPAATALRDDIARLLATEAAEAVTTVIGAIKRRLVLDRIVIISGTISASAPVDKGQHLSVQDATGEIQVVLGEKVLAGLSAADLQPGRAITITGPSQSGERNAGQLFRKMASAVKLHTSSSVLSAVLQAGRSIYSDFVPTEGPIQTERKLLNQNSVKRVRRARVAPCTARTTAPLTRVNVTSQLPFPLTASI